MLCARPMRARNSYGALATATGTEAKVLTRTGGSGDDPVRPRLPPKVPAPRRPSGTGPLPLARCAGSAQGLPHVRTYGSSPFVERGRAPAARNVGVRRARSPAPWGRRLQQPGDRPTPSSCDRSGLDARLGTVQYRGRHHGGGRPRGGPGEDAQRRTGLVDLGHHRHRRRGRDRRGEGRGRQASCRQHRPAWLARSPRHERNGYDPALRRVMAGVQESIGSSESPSPCRSRSAARVGFSTAPPTGCRPTAPSHSPPRTRRTAGLRRRPQRAESLVAA